MPRERITNNLIIKALLKPDIYPHEVSNIELIETHISWIFLTGRYAYKLKKPLKNIEETLLIKPIIRLREMNY